MSFPELRRKVVDTVFERFGEDAIWTGLGEAVRVRFRTRDEDARFQEGQYVTRVTIIEVRSWEYPRPVRGDVVTVAAGNFSIGADPMLDPRGVWICAVGPHEI